jgi:CRISPR-associated endonuclease Cas1
MRHQSTEHTDGGIVVASGYGVKLYVERGHLIVHDGIGRQRRTRRYHRVTSGVRRVLVLGHTGFVTFDALRWIRDAGATFVQIDRDGELVTVIAGAGPDMAGLRRAQALAADSPIGLEIARMVIVEKLRGQEAIQRELEPADWAGHALAAAVTDAAAATTMEMLLSIEAVGASAYWDTWAYVALRFATRDQPRVPEHWQRFGQRHSLLTSRPRHATTPANAILNYLYALLEIETTLACYAVSLDPGIGIFHVDRRGRDSLALDLMEAGRPTIDAYLLALLRERVFRREDFTETRRGVCRLTPGLATQLADTHSTWRGLIAPIVEATAHLLSGPQNGLASTPLTQTRRRAASAKRQVRDTPRIARAPALPSTCRRCGTPLPNRRRRECDTCRRDRLATVANEGRVAGADVLESLRATGRDPAHGGAAARRRGTKNAAHQRAMLDWDRNHPAPDSAVFTCEILPGLRTLDLATLTAATGLSEHYCSLIRLGKRVPHPRHWGAFGALVGGSLNHEAPGSG